MAEHTSKQLLVLIVLFTSLPAMAGNSSVEDLVAGNNQFALDLLGKLSSEPGNVLISPHSISTALAMTYAGARGDTEAEIAKALHFAMGQTETHEAFHGLASRLAANKKESCTLKIANALWPAEGSPLVPSYVDLIERQYSGSCRPLNYGNAKTAADTINGWVSDQTNARITKLISADLLSRDVVLVLTNAVFFKGDWQVKFDKKLTRRGSFLKDDGTTVEADMMEGTGSFRRARSESAELLEMPYAGGDLSMAIIMPRGGTKLNDLVRSLSAEELRRLISNAKKRRTRVTMPKFTLRDKRELSDNLQAMGMKLAFTPQADFRGMCKGGCYIDLVLHETFVSVDEEGTEAAGATAVITKRGGGPEVFRINRPFLFVIRDSSTGSFMFVGSVVDPTR